ncbi:MAG: diguanylate cyclase [Candidatus Omnitrophota bacterium]
MIAKVIVSIILIASVILRFWATFLALRLIKLTGKRKGWFLIAIAIFFMAIRSAVALYHVLTFHVRYELVHSADMVSEILGLIVSVFMVIGISWIGPFFLSIIQSEETVRKSGKKYRALLENIPDVAWTADRERRTVFISSKAEKILGYAPYEICKEGGTAWFDKIHPSDLEKTREAYHSLFEKAKKLDVEYRLRSKDGEWVWLNERASSAYEIDGVFYTDGIFTDITERKKSEKALEKFRRFNEMILNSAGEGIFGLDIEGRHSFVNPSAAKMLGYEIEELIGQPSHSVWHHSKADGSPYPEEECPMYLAYKDGAVHRGSDEVFWKKDGTSFSVEYVSTPIEENGKLIGAVVTFTDIGERKVSEERLKQLCEEVIKTNRRLKELALRDSHTGLYNHRYLEIAMEAEYNRAKRDGWPLSVMMMDIDYFKSINDVYGHEFGDLVLRQLATQLKKLVRQYNSVVRYGGEEFVIISPETGRAAAVNLAGRILDALNVYNFGNKEHTVKLKLSIAVATYPDDDIVKGIGLVGIADAILNKVKESGGNRVYSSEDTPIVKRPLLIKNGSVKLLNEKMDKLTKRANQSLVEAIMAFAKTIELKDHYTGAHVEKTVRYATETAKIMKLLKYDIELISQAAMLHDLGKIGISENILLKKGKLSEEEFEQIKKHPQIAADILRPVQFFHPIIPLILCHHERWDGTGYPNGLKGEQIPVGARIIAVADAYQALISDRPYRKGHSKEDARKIIEDDSGSHFCPAVVAAFLKVLEKEESEKTENNP